MPMRLGCGIGDVGYQSLHALQLLMMGASRMVLVRSETSLCVDGAVVNILTMLVCMPMCRLRESAGWTSLAG